MDLPSDAEIKAMRTDKLKVTLTDVVNRIRNSRNESAMLQEILQEIRAGNDERKALREEISQLKRSNEVIAKELDDIKSKLPSTASNAPKISPPSDWAEVVAKSVRTVMDDKHTKNDVVISPVDEGKNDHAFLNDLCKKMKFERLPTDAKRVGRRKDGCHRPLKVAFPCPFDARMFHSRFDELKTELKMEKVMVRPWRSKEEQDAFKANKTVLNKLNKEAKDAGSTDISFSLRENGTIRKFQKASDEKWMMVNDWSYDPQQQTPLPQQQNSPSQQKGADSQQQSSGN